MRLISSASRTLREDRTRHESPGAATRGRIFFDDVGARDIGRHQIRRELDALEDQPQRLRHGPHQQCLGRSGKAGDQAMPADKQRDHHLLQHLFLADDHLADLAHDVLSPRGSARLGLSDSAESVRGVDMSCGHV